MSDSPSRRSSKRDAGAGASAHATTGVTPKSDRPNPRLAALAAAEARLRPSADPASSAGPGPSAASTATPSSKPEGSSSSPASPSPGLFGSGPGAASPSPRASGWQPTEKDERDARVNFSRLLDKGLVRDNGYKQVAEGVETLVAISNNILGSDDPKFRDLKESSKTLQNKVLSLKGGHDYLIALGFRVTTREFARHYVFTASLKSMWTLRIGAEILSEHLASLKERAANSALSAEAHKSAEATRVAQALAQIEADRDTVRQRAARERIMRGRDERLAREDEEKKARVERERARGVEQAERARVAGAGWGGGSGWGAAGVGSAVGAGAGTGAGALGGDHYGGGAADEAMDSAEDVFDADALLDQQEEDEEDEVAQANSHGPAHAGYRGGMAGYADDDEEDDEDVGAYQPSWGTGRRLDE